MRPDWDNDGSGNPPVADVFAGRYGDPDRPVVKFTIMKQPNQKLSPIELKGPAV